MAQLIEEKLAQMEDPLSGRHLLVKRTWTGSALPINGYLADILLNNLLTNAIRHNQDGGQIVDTAFSQDSNFGSAIRAPN